MRWHRALLKSEIVKGPLLASSVRWNWQPMHVAAIVCVAILAFYPTTRNGFLPLGFDDAVILDTPTIRELSGANLVTLATTFYHAHYVPLTMLSLALDYQLWGLDPWGYHVVNVVLHVATAVLFYLFLCPIVPTARVAALAAALFAVHPVQLEAVSVAMQRKTVLAGLFFFLSLILYQAWRRTGARHWYVLCLMAFAAAALAKPAAVSLPFLLLLYDYVFAGRVGLRPTLPFLAIAGFISVTAVKAHAAVGAVHSWHGGNIAAHLLMVSRVFLEYVDAGLLPVNLSPIYYYPPSLIYHPTNFLALVLIPAVVVYVSLQRRRLPWTFFCLWWFVVGLLPESNLAPLAQLRADRFMYLALPGLTLWVALGWERLLQATAGPRWQRPAYLLGPGLVVLLAVICYQSASVWHDNVSAWTRVVERHHWAGVAHAMLGRAYYWAGRPVEAELQGALRLSDNLSDPYLYLARIYADRGAMALARGRLRRFLELVPGDPEGLELLAAIGGEGGD